MEGWVGIKLLYSPSSSLTETVRADSSYVEPHTQPMTGVSLEERARGDTWDTTS